jgi:hypothetical protein
MYLDADFLLILKKQAANMGFSAMLADEYILIAPFAYDLQSGPNNKSQQKNITSTSVFQSAFVQADVTQNISTVESPNVVRYYPAETTRSKSQKGDNTQ